MDPEDVDYVCTLTESSLKKAQKELNEDPKQRMGAVQALRKWVKQQTHFTCRTDTLFLLTYLRRAKFSQLTARTLIQNYMEMKTQNPDIMSNLDIQSPHIMKILRYGSVVYLPNADSEGRKMAIIRPGQIPVSELSDPLFNNTNEMRLALSMTELLITTDENVAVTGLILVFDFTAVTMKHLTRQTAEERKLNGKIWQDCYPTRIKAFVFYNPGLLLEFFLNLVKQFMKKKNQEKIQVHDTMESLYKLVPMQYWPEEYLPDDYKGQSAGSIASIIDFWDDFLKKNEKLRRKILDNTSDVYRIDDKKKPAQQIPQESFRKLNVD